MLWNNAYYYKTQIDFGAITFNILELLPFTKELFSILLL